MRTPLLALVFVTGCFSTPLGSNDPDSGVSCPRNEAPGGSASLQGEHAFTVGSAYQSASQNAPPDAGVTGASLTVQVLRAAISCAQKQDAGTGEGLFATVISPGVDRVGAGRYPIATQADGGAWFYGFAIVDGHSRGIAEGTLELTKVASCSASGTFDVRLRIEDGGLSPLSGTFSSEYCRELP